LTIYRSLQITYLKLRNFLSFDDNEQEIKFDHLNTIVGPNNAGKTNIFRAISFVTETLTKNATNPDPYYHDSDFAKSIGVKIGIKFNDEELDAIANFIFCASLPDAANTAQGDSKEPTVDIIEHFMEENFKKIAESFREITLIVKKKEMRDIYKGDHLMEFHCGTKKLFVQYYGRITKDEPDTTSYYSFAQAILEKIKENHPRVTNYLSKKTTTMPRIRLKEEQIINFFSSFLEGKNGYGLDIRSFNVDEGRLREINYPQLVKLRAFLAKVGHADRHIDFGNLIAKIFVNAVIRTSDLRSKPKSFLNLGQAYQSPYAQNVTGEDIPSILFSLKNSTNPNARRRYNEILKQFHELTNLEFDIGIVTQKVTHLTGEKIVPLRDDRSRIDGIVAAGIQQEQIEETQNELVIRIIKGDKSIPLEFASAGLFETILLLTTMMGQEGKVILLDEPAVNIHPILQNKILELIETQISKNDNQIILVTHSPYLVNPENLENIWRVISEKNGTKIINIKNAVSGLPDEDEQKIINQLRNSDIRSVLFARGAILVEGASDKFVIEKIDKYLSMKGKGANIEGQDWSVIDMGGKYSLTLFIKLVQNLRIPYVAVLDYDALFQCEKKLKTNDDKIATSAIPICLYNAGLLDNSIIKKIKKIENTIKRQTLPNKNGKPTEQFWYPHKHYRFLDSIAKTNKIFVLTKNLENVLQTPLKRTQSKPLKDLETINQKISQNKIPREFYDVIRFVKKNMK